jgi:rhizosphere induced protein
MTFSNRGFSLAERWHVACDSLGSPAKKTIDDERRSQMGIHVSYATAPLAALSAEGTTYSMTLQNESAQPWTFYVYQRQPQQSNDLFSLAWFSSPFLITVGSRITFEWDIAYNFVWGATGIVRPGVTFSAGGEIDCDPNGANTTTFSSLPGPNLSPAVTAPPAGSLVINDARDVPNSTYSVGIGMSGAGTFVVQAGTNLKHQFTPTPTYWIAAGTDVQVGTVLDIQTITTTAQVQFPPNVFSITRTLNAQNQWS